ncbi:MAG: SurA N-terminal domain-containing protein [Methylococcales bacterium]
MLQSIRDRAQGVLAWVILVLICIPFIFWGIENYVGGGREQAVAVVGDKEIYQADVSRAYQEMAARLGDFSQIDEATLKALALKNLIDEEVLRQSALDRGFIVSDGQVRDSIRSLPYFQNEKGFDKEKYDNVLKAQSITEPYFVERIRRGMVIGQIQEGITQSTFATESEIERFLNLRDQVRTFEYVAIPVVLPEAEISPDEIESYYRQNQASFQNPEKVSVNYIELNIEDIAAKLKVKEEDLQAFYESQKDLYTRKERRKVSHILAAIDAKNGDASGKAALEKIGQAQKMLENGEEFAKVAEKLSDDPVSAKQGGNLGLINPGEMVKEFETAAFALNPGQVSGPVKSPFGYHLIKVTELQPEEVKAFDSVRQEVEKAFRRQQAENTFYELGERLAQISYENPDSLAPAAESAGLEIKTSDLFSRQENGGFGTNPKIVEVAFGEQVLEGKNSDPIELATNRVMILRLEKHEPATARTLDVARDQVVNEIRVKKAREAAGKESDRLFAELKAGHSLADLAKSNNLEIQKPEPIARNDAKLPRDLVKALFSLNKPAKGEAAPFQSTLSDGQHVVAVLLDVQRKSGDNPDDKEKQVEQAEQWLNTQQGSAEFSDLLAQIREDIGVTVSEEKE